MSTAETKTQVAADETHSNPIRDLSRPTGSRYIKEFDGLRGFSIVFVIMYHCWNYAGDGLVGNFFNRTASIGWCGVDIFFVLSGFLITGILLDTRDSPRYWRNFFIRRGLRIFPLYYAVLILLVIDAWFLTHWGIGIRDPALLMIDRIWINFLYLSNFSMALQGSNHVPMNIAWSLAIEEQFYLLYPAIILWCSKRNLAKVLLGVVLIAPVLRALVWAIGPQPAEGPYALPFCRMDTLAMGALAQIAIRNSSSQLCRRFAQMAPVLCALAIIFMSVWKRYDLLFIILGYSLNAVAAAALLVRALSSDSTSVLRRTLSNPALIYFGKLAYGLYLLHLMGHAVFDRFVTPLFSDNANTHAEFSGFRLLGISAIALLMATASYFLFEMPILRLKDRFAPSNQHYKEPMIVGA